MNCKQLSFSPHHSANSFQSSACYRECCAAKHGSSPENAPRGHSVREIRSLQSRCFCAQEITSFYKALLSIKVIITMGFYLCPFSSEPQS